VHYDVILDNVSNRPLRRALTPEGTLVANGGGSPGAVFGVVGSMLRLFGVNAFVGQQLRMILPGVPAGPIHEDLLAVTALIEAGKLTPVVDRTYPLADVAEGVRCVEQSHARGKAVVTCRESSVSPVAPTTAIENGRQASEYTDMTDATPTTQRRRPPASVSISE
jgi:NADPH:quinone reductase-like Zn-dependent oxidoreductase